MAEETTTDQNKYQKQIDAWTSYTYYLVAVDGLLHATQGICATSLKGKEDTLKKVVAAFTAAHDALDEVDKLFREGIARMKDGKAPEHPLEPAPVPKWDTKPTSTDIFTGTWETIKVTLEQVMTKVGSGSAMATTILGLANAGETCTKVIAEAFK